MRLSVDVQASAAPAAVQSGRDFFGAPSLIRNEQAAGYENLLAQVAAAVTPVDILEQMWVRDVVDLAWQAARWRRLKAALMNACAHEGVDKVLQPFERIDAYGLSKRWAAGDAGAARKVGQLLASAGLTLDAVMAQTLRLHVDTIERLDRMIMGAEARRNVALRELERHRAGFAAMLRRATDDITDAEFTVIAPGAAAAPAPASADSAA